VKFYRQVLAVPDRRGKCEYEPSGRMALFGYNSLIINILSNIKNINFIQIVSELLCVKCWESAASTLFINGNTILYIYISLTDFNLNFEVQNIQNTKKNLASLRLTRL